MTETKTSTGPEYRPPTTAEEILERYKAGERSFPGTELPENSTLRGANLSEADFSRSWLSEVDFRGADLRGVCFDRCNVKLTDFRDADLRGASFRDSALCGVLLAGARLDGVSTEGAEYYGVPVHDIHEFARLLNK